jgi:ABC-type transport system involved in cytochrome c biogenesis permease component
MSLLPVIERELRVASRRPQTYRNRLLAGAIVMAVVLWTLRQNRYLLQADIGSQIFEAATNITLLVALFAGLFHTADAISGEVRGGTLGLLYLTDLKSLHIVLGKLAALSIPAIFSLATILPILAIPILIGGVTYGELARSALVLVNALGLSLCAGMLASALVKDDRTALLVNLALAFLPMTLAIVIRQPILNPFALLFMARDFQYRSRPEEFWAGAALHVLIPCLLLSLASVAARRLWQERPRHAVAERRFNAWRDWSAGTAAERDEWRTALLEKNPALWLACRRRVRTALLWAILGAELVWLTWLYFSHGQLQPMLIFIASVVAHWILKATVAFAACRAFADEKQTGAFELLFTTHLTAQQLIMGHVWGLVRSFGPAVAAVMTIEIIWTFNHGLNELSGFVGSEMTWMRIGFLLLDLVTIAIYGLAIGYKTGHAGKAAARTLALVIIVPHAAFFLLGGPGLLRNILVIYAAIDVYLIVRGLMNLVALRPQEFLKTKTSSALE